MSDGFPQGVDKRERLLEWMRDGDPSRVPIMIGFGYYYLAASYFRLPLDQVTWPLAARAAVETNTENIAFVGPPGFFFAIDFTDKLRIDHHYETLDDGTKRRTSHLTTPAGVLREIYDDPPGIGSVHREFYVKGDAGSEALTAFLTGCYAL